MGTLIIIGNGFDLHCELKTKYSDFFKWLAEREHFSESYKIIKKDFENRLTLPIHTSNLQKLTFWEFFYILKEVESNSNSMLNTRIGLI